MTGSRSDEAGSPVTRTQVVVTVVALAFALLPALLAIILDSNALFDFLNRNLAYTLYVLGGGTLLLIALDWIYHRSKRAREMGEVAIGNRTTLVLRSFTFILTGILYVGYWKVFFSILALSTLAFVVALLFHFVWIVAAYELRKYRGKGNWIEALQLTFLPLAIVLMFAAPMIG